MQSLASSLVQWPSSTTVFIEWDADLSTPDSFGSRDETCIFWSSFSENKIILLCCCLIDRFLLVVNCDCTLGRVRSLRLQNRLRFVALYVDGKHLQGQRNFQVQSVTVTEITSYGVLSHQARNILWLCFSRRKTVRSLCCVDRKTDVVLIEKLITCFYVFFLWFSEREEGNYYDLKMLKL